MTALRFDGYGFTYSGASRRSLSDVTLDLHGGQVVSVIAPQGGGKTTLLRAAAGLLGDIYEGESVGRCHPEPLGRHPEPLGRHPERSEGSAPRGKLREGSAFVRPGAFFDGYVQVTLAVETVREEIGLPLYAAGMNRRDREARVTAVARELRIEHLLDRDVTALSGGEEKLVGIAAALAPDARIHVLDEPFEQLDVSHFAAVIRAAKVRARAGRLVLVGTGSVDTALNIASAAVAFDGARWRLIDRPTYADLAVVPGLAVSSLGEFLRVHSAAPTGVRRFRDGVLRVGHGHPERSEGSAFRQKQIPRFARDDKLLEVRNVSFAYGDAKPALSDASLTLDVHMVCGVLGPNGAGKSTLARLAAGVFQPTAGTVSVGGKNLATTTGPDRARVVRVTFQTPEHELFRQTLGDELDWEARLLGIAPDAVRAQMKKDVDAVGVDLPLDKHPYDLDPWQRKLFACLSALAVPNRLVILDEPTLRLGQQVRARLGEALRRYASAGGAVMLVTHDHEFAASICQTIAVVKRGRIEAAGPAGAVLATAAGHAATNIYSFPSYFLDQAVRRRSKLPVSNRRDLQA